MRSAASSNEVMTIIRDEIRKYWYIPLLGIVWFLFSGFVPALIESDAGFNAQRLQDLAHNQSFGYIVSILIMSIGGGMAVFSYLRSPGVSDYMHSLPISRNRLFLAKVLAGLIMMAGPILLNAAIMSIVGGPGLFVRWACLAAVMGFSIFGITVFAGVLSGNTLMHLFNTLFFNGFVTVFLLMIEMVCGYLLTGYASPDRWDQVMQASNPLTAFTMMSSGRAAVCGLYLAVGAAALVLAGLLYRRRRPERTGASLVFPWLRTVLFLYCIFCGSIILGLTFSDILTSSTEHSIDIPMIVGMLIGGLLIFIIGSVLIERTAKIFTRRNLIPACLSLVLALATVGCISHDAFGYSSYVPEASEVETVYLDPNDMYVYYGDDGYNSMSSRFNANSYDLPEGTPVGPADRKVIGMQSGDAVDAARAFHQALIDQDRAQGEGAVTSYVKLVYELKNGHKVYRQFEVYLVDEDGREGGAQGYAPGIIEAFGKYYDSKEFKRKYSLNNLKETSFDRGTIYFVPVSEEGEVLNIDGYLIPRKYAPELRAAMEADFRAMPFEKARACGSYFTVTSAGSSWEEMTFPVAKDAKATNAWLREHADLLK